MKENRTVNVRMIAVLGVFAAIAYALTFVSRFLPPLIPAVPFLKYDPKDFIIAIAGFMFGPLPALAVIVIVSLIEMITVSGTGFIGLIMNILSSAAFVMPAALIYRYKRTIGGAITGLLAGTVTMIGVMLLWNYIITPIYMQYPREAVKALLLPAFLPFNAIKAAVNMALTLLLYKPLVMALKKAQVLPPSNGQNYRGGRTVGAILFALVLLVTAALLILIFNSVI